MSGKQASLFEWDRAGDLPPAQRRDYLAVERDGYTMREWANLIGVGAGTVGRNVSRAKENLGED